MAGPPPPLASPMLHTHSSANLRAAFHEIADDPRATRADWSGKVVVSHPPSLNSLRATSDRSRGGEGETLAMSCRPLNEIQPLDPTTLDRIPLSTPPSPTASSPSSHHGDDTAELGESRRKSWKAWSKSKATAPDNEAEEENFPLIVVTGGSGFIGSHTVLEILQEGLHGVVVLDNLDNSQMEVLHRVRILAAQHHTAIGTPPSRHPPLYFHNLDITSRSSLSSLFSLYSTSPTTSRIVAAIHFAALKSVAGSLKDPLSYYQINVGGTLNLVEVLAKWGCKRLVFSSSCVVYGSECDGEGIREEMCDVRLGASKGITNPYGRTKRMCEEILSDLSASDPEWYTMSLRYTNPSGAHPSGYIGEDPTNAANLMPLVTHVLQGKRDHVKVFGADYDTPDGTGVRDFIHVVDLAKAHLAALRYLRNDPAENNSTFNLGTNQGTSVLTVIETLSLIAQRPIKMIVCGRRPGDLGCVVCCADKAERELGWKAEKTIVEMCRDLVNWQALNPSGYASAPTPRVEKEALM